MSSRTQSSRLARLPSAARRSAELPPSPKRRSKTTRGWASDWQRGRRRRPREVVLVHAGVAVVALPDHFHQIHRQLERGQLRLLPHLLRGDLIDRRAEIVVAAFGPLRFGGAQERRIRRGVRAGIRVLQLHVAEHRHVLHHGRQRAERRRQLGQRTRLAREASTSRCANPSGRRRTRGGAPGWRPSVIGPSARESSHRAGAGPRSRPCRVRTFVAPALFS